jgi:hypothetical protein
MPGSFHPFATHREEHMASGSLTSRPVRILLSFIL